MKIELIKYKLAEVETEVEMELVNPELMESKIISESETESTKHKLAIEIILLFVVLIL